MSRAGGGAERADASGAPQDGEGPRGSLLMISAEEVERLFDPATAVASQRHAFGELGAGRARLAPRVLLDGPNGSTAFSYASRVSDAQGAVAKFGSVVLDNAARGLPAVNALVTVLDADSGVPRAVLEGNSVTTLRTAAASAVAAQALVADGPVVLTVIGTGVQAAAHVAAMATALDLVEVRLWGRDRAKAESLAAALAARHGLSIAVPATVPKALTGASLVVTCTTATSPVLEAADLATGALVISVGSFAPDHHEVGQDLIARAALVVVDHHETALAQAGPIVAALAGGSLGEEAIVELGAVVAGAHPGRTSAEDVVYYNSVGIGIQDAAAAQAILVKAEEQGAGTRLAW